MKQMAVIYVQDMVRERHSYCEDTVSPFSKVKWQGRKTDHSLPSGDEIVNVWSYKPTESN